MCRWIYHNHADAKYACPGCGDVRKTAEELGKKAQETRERLAKEQLHRAAHPADHATPQSLWQAICDFVVACFDVVREIFD